MTLPLWDHVWLGSIQTRSNRLWPCLRIRLSKLLVFDVRSPYYSIGAWWPFLGLGLCIIGGASLETEGAQHWEEAFKKQGYFEWKVTVARKQVIAKINPQSVEDFCSWDTSFVWEQFPKETDVLTIHGTADKIVPVWELLFYSFSLFISNAASLGYCWYRSSIYFFLNCCETRSCYWRKIFVSWRLSITMIKQVRCDDLCTSTQRQITWDPFSSSNGKRGS